MSTASFLLNVLLSELYWSISISFFTLVKRSRAYERGEGPTAELGPKRNISKCLIVSSPQELSTSSLPVHSSEWVPGIAPGRRCSSVLTVSPKRKGAASFLIALKLNMMGAPRTHGHKAKMAPWNSTLSHLLRVKLQKFLCSPQVCKMSALSPLLFPEVLKFTCQMATLSFPSPPPPAAAPTLSPLAI